MPTDISWTDETWNPVHGCHKVSAGCKHCYAERISHDWGHTEQPWTAENAAENVRLQRHKLSDPRGFPAYAHADWADGPAGTIPHGSNPGFDAGHHPLRVFVNSMSDLFHATVPDAYIREVLNVCRNHPEYIFQVLTKRPGRAAHIDWRWPDNVWLGTSVEAGAGAAEDPDDDVEDVRPRLDLLRGADAETLFVSFEPLIAPIGPVDLDGYAWAIVGGESHPDGDYRPMDPAWARALRDQCREQDVAFFFKQSPGTESETGRLLAEPDFRGARYYEEYPPVPAVTREALGVTQQTLGEVSD